MGHIVERVLRERNHEVVAVIDNLDDWQTHAEDFRKA